MWKGDRELSQLDVTRCRQLRAAAERVKCLEGAVASAAGLAMVFADPDVALTPEYLRLLESLAAAVADNGPPGGGALGEVPLRVRSTAAGSAGREGPRLKVEEVLGITVVTADTSAREVLAFLQVHAIFTSPAMHWTDVLRRCTRPSGCVKCSRQNGGAVTMTVFCTPPGARREGGCCEEKACGRWGKAATNAGRRAAAAALAAPVRRR